MEIFLLRHWPATWETQQFFGFEHALQGEASPLARDGQTRGKGVDSHPIAAIISQSGWKALQLLIAFLKTLCCLPTSSLAHSLCVCLGADTSKLAWKCRGLMLYSYSHSAIYSCGSMCKLILEAAHLNGANCIGPLDKIRLLSDVQRVSCICVGVLERDRLSENLVV